MNLGCHRYLRRTQLYVMSVRELNAMVEAVNAEAVDPQERLGNFVYRFDREAQRLEKAVEQAEELDFEPGMSPVFA